MKRISSIFLQVITVIVAILVLLMLIRMPLTEGRAAHLTVLQVYADPFIIYGYVISIAFFVALYKAFRLLGYIGRDRVFSPGSVSALKSIKYCAIIFSIMVMIAGIYIRLFHAKEDDPAGFIALCFITTILAGIVASAAAIFERILQKAIDMKSENDLTI